MSVHKGQGWRPLLDAHCFWADTASLNNITKRAQSYCAKWRPYLKMVRKCCRVLWVTRLKWTVSKCCMVRRVQIQHSCCQSMCPLGYRGEGPSSMFSAFSFKASIPEGMEVHECIQHGSSHVLHHVCYPPDTRTDNAKHKVVQSDCQ